MNYKNLKKKYILIVYEYNLLTNIFIYLFNKLKNHKKKKRYTLIFTKNCILYRPNKTLV
jgi:hypothetical protein